MYFVVGLLDEYLGYQPQAQQPDIVERLYCDEHEKLPVFLAQFALLARQQGVSPAITETRLQNCIIFLHSLAVASLIKQFYGRPEADGSFKITLNHFAAASRNEKLAYLSGAYCRFGRSRTFRFANAAHKARVIADLLRQLGFEGVSVDSVKNRIPNANTVRFGRAPNGSAFWLVPCRLSTAR